MLQDTTSNLHCSCPKTCKEMSGAQAALRALCLSVGRSSGRTIHPGLAPHSSVERSSGSRAVPLTITGELRMIIDWTVRCDWLQVTSCNIMLMRAARLVQVLQDVLQVLS